ncbi:MAG: 50S ribosomal protein L6 [Patescibacteria group bacterium]
MSRVGAQPITLPTGVTIEVTSGKIEVKGPKGSLSLAIHPDVRIDVAGSEVTIVLNRTSRQAKKLWGTFRALVANMVIGVVSGYEKKLELEGVGYRVELKGKDLQFALGFSHPVFFSAPEGITFVVEKNTVTISGISKDLVGRTAAKIRALKKPEPYKGKGIRYQGEVIRRKAGKKATGSA